MYLYDHPTSRLCVGLGFDKARKQASKKAPWHQALTHQMSSSRPQRSCWPRAATEQPPNSSSSKTFSGVSTLAANPLILTTFTGGASAASNVFYFVEYDCKYSISNGVITVSY